MAVESALRRIGGWLKGRSVKKIDFSIVSFSIPDWHKLAYIHGRSKCCKIHVLAANCTSIDHIRA